VVLAAGAGLFQSLVVDKNAGLPVQLVRGQSIEMTLDGDYEGHSINALLCGKYISPLPEPNRVLIGATHEFMSDPLDRDQVEKELRDRSYIFASSVWDNGTIDRITSGYRIQSNRGKHGRLPIIGQYQSPHHPNTWIFTGLSSRGLLYHGIFGEFLSDMILGDANMTSLPVEIDWWKN
jgi:glycine/D-amino acid oxidase-like deaminating enzyme